MSGTFCDPSVHNPFSIEFFIFAYAMGRAMKLKREFISEIIIFCPIKETFMCALWLCDDGRLLKILITKVVLSEWRIVRISCDRAYHGVRPYDSFALARPLFCDFARRKKVGHIVHQKIGKIETSSSQLRSLEKEVPERRYGWIKNLSRALGRN